MRRFIFVSAAVINAGDKKKPNTIRSFSPLITNLSTRKYLEYMHMLFTSKFSKNKIKKNNPIYFAPYLYKIIMIIYANMHVTIT